MGCKINDFNHRIILKDAMVWIPSAEFLMARDNSQSRRDEMSVHNVMFTDFGWKKQRLPMINLLCFYML